MECGPSVVKWLRKERAGEESVDGRSGIAEIQSCRRPGGGGQGKLIGN
jgi:hypothetical protein